MKWLLYFSTAAIILFAGYWLGANKKIEPKQAQEQQHSITKTKKTAISQRAENIEKPPFVTKAEKDRSLPTAQNTKKNDPRQIFLRHLENQEYTSAINLLTDSWNNTSPNGPRLKSLYISHIQQLLAQPQKNSGRINNAIQTYLGDFYDDTEALLLLAKQYALSNDFYGMLNTLQLSKSYAYTNEQQKVIEAAHTEFIRYTDTSLSEQEQWETLIGIYQHSEDTGLLREQDILRLVELHMMQGETFLALDYADRLKDRQQWQKKLATLLPQTKKIETESTENHTGPSINLQKVGDQFIIITTLSGSDANLLIDTGASITTISKEYFESIKRKSRFSYQQKQQFLTANGETTGEIYIVDTFQIGQHLLTNIEIAVIDFPTSQYSSGLLGMNVLRNFKFEIDQVNASLTLIKVSP
jgi:clan AA aspartic protease (TIGR02281 family)